MAFQSWLGLFLGPIVQILLAPKPKAPKPLALQYFDIPTADADRELPWICGSVTIDGANVIWYGNLGVRARKKKAGLFGKKATVGYFYSMGLHFALAHEVDRVYRITAGDRLLWDGDATGNGQIEVGMPNLFGGTDSEGGMTGTVDFLFGAADQVLTGKPAALLGTLPAYRRVMTVLYDGEIGYNVRAPKAFAFGVTRILSGWAGGAPWEPDTAPILLEAGVTPPPVVLVLPTDVFEYQFTAPTVPPVPSAFTPPTSGYATANGLFGHWPESAPGPSPYATLWPVTNHMWLRKVITAPGGRDIVISGNVENALLMYFDGVYIRGVNPNNSQGGNLLFTQTVPAATATAGEHVIAFYCMNETGSALFEDYTGVAMQVEYTAPAADKSAMNPAHMAYQLMTTPSPRGMGYPTSIINEAQFAEAAQTLFDEGLGLCIQWASSAPIDELLREVERHASASIRQNMFNGGKFEFHLLRADYTPSALPLFDESNIIEGSFEFQRAGYGETVNEITVTYRDWKSNEDLSVTVQNLANVAAQGGVVSETREYPGIPTAELAARVAERDLRVSSTPLAKVRFQATRNGAQLLPGDVIRVSWGKLGLVQVVLRIVSIDYGQILSNRVSIEALEDVFGLPANSYVTPQPVGWVEPDTSPLPVAQAQAIELPLYSIALEIGLAEAQSLSADAAYVGALAVAPQSTALQFDIYSGLAGSLLIDDGEGDFAPSGLLTAALAADATAATLDNLTRLGEVEPGDLAVIGSGATAEWVRILTVNAGTGGVTFDRGMLDTTPAAWPDNTRVWFADGSSDYASTARATGDDVDLQLLTITSGGTLPQASAPVLSITPNQRLSRPYPPGNVQINGEAHPSAPIVGPLTVTWAHRDRLQQGIALVGQAEASIGPESGTTYSLWLYDHDTGTLLDTATSISSNTWTSAVAGNYLARVELAAVRSGLESWQRQIRVFDWDGDLYPAALTIVNPGAEAGSMAGWTITSGNPSSLVGPAGDGTNARTGTRFFYPGTTAQGDFHQDIALDSAYHADIDATLLELEWTYYQCCTSTDEQRIRVEFYDGTAALISSSTPAYASDGGANVWVLKTHAAAVPAGTRTVRLINQGRRVAGTSNDGYSDDISARLVRA